MNNTVELLIPLKDKVEKYLFDKGAVKQRTENGKFEPEARVDLTRNTDLEIVTIYDAEIRGLCHFYFLASNYRSLNYFSYLMEYSCLKTLAWKHRASCQKFMTNTGLVQNAGVFPMKLKQAGKYVSSQNLMRLMENVVTM